MRFPKFQNKEDVIRRYLSGELSSEEHIEVGDLIREDTDWKSAYERQRGKIEHVQPNFPQEGAPVREIEHKRGPTPQPRPSQAPQNQPNPIIKFLRSYGIWILIYLLFRFGAPLFKSIKNRIDDFKQGRAPESTTKIDQYIAKDLEARYSNPEDSLSHLIPLCTEKLADAERHYQDGKYRRQLEALIDIAQDETSPCKDEATYLAAEASLKIGEPRLTLDLVSKIGDLDRFGPDVQWIMAKAVFQLSEEGNATPAKAQRSIERALAFPQNEKYKAEADSLLQILSVKI